MNTSTDMKLKPIVDVRWQLKFAGTGRGRSRRPRWQRKVAGSGRGLLSVLVLILNNLIFRLVLSFYAVQK